MNNLKSQPIIRWAGSKRKVLPLLKENLPTKYNRYVEPFCGSASLFFEQDNRKGLLSDINADLINAFNQIKIDSSIRDLVIKIPNTKEKYYEVRAKNPDNLNDLDRAVRFLYLNRYCFNGVYRTNRKGEFNVPKGTRTGDFPSQLVFDDISEKLQEVNLVVSDYSYVLRSLIKGDFVYVDPPYAKSGKSTGEYGPNSFNSDNLESFVNQLRKLNNREVKFLFSYRACDDLVRVLEEEFIVKHLSVKRHVSGFKTSWNDAHEILVKNYEE